MAATMPPSHPSRSAGSPLPASGDGVPPAASDNRHNSHNHDISADNTAHVVSQPPLDPTSSALSRLQASRLRLRAALIPPDPDAPASASAQTPGRRPRRLGALWRSWRRSMHGWPLVDLALGTAQTWWHRQPLRPVAELLVDELRATAVPLVRKHPLLTVAAAGVLGVLLVAGRPWRWPLVAKQVQRAPQRVGGWLIRQLSQASVQASLIALLMLWARPPAANPAQPQPQPPVPETGTRPAAPA